MAQYARQPLVIFPRIAQAFGNLCEPDVVITVDSHKVTVRQERRIVEQTVAPRCKRASGRLANCRHIGRNLFKKRIQNLQSRCGSVCNSRSVRTTMPRAASFVSRSAKVWHQTVVG